MTRLLELAAAIALLVWGAQQVRAAVMQVLGERLRYALARLVGHRASALAAGMAVTAVVQSSTATGLMAASFVGQGVLALPLALAVMLGADVGSSLVALALSLDLSWLAPACIVVGVALSVARRESEIGRVFVGLGLMMLALKLVRLATLDLAQADALRGLLAALGDDLPLAVTAGAALAMLAYSGLAIVLLAATLAATGAVPAAAACGLVLGANLGSGLIGLLGTAGAGPGARRVPAGNLVFKAAGVALALPCVPWVAPLLAGEGGASRVVALHFAFNAALALLFIGLTERVAALVERVLPLPAAPPDADRKAHLDAAALASPALALACAAREAVHQADVVETMLRGIPAALAAGDLAQSRRLRALDDAVDTTCSAIKAYLARLPDAALSAAQRRRRGEILAFSINLEQVADTAERMLIDVEERRIRAQRRLSPAGLAELGELHAEVLATLRLGMSVFLGRQACDAQALVAQEARFRARERHSAAAHLERYAARTPESVETSGLHLDLLSGLQRMHAHLCAIGHARLEGGAVEAPT